MRRWSDKLDGGTRKGTYGGKSKGEKARRRGWRRVHAVERERDARVRSGG